MLDSSVNSRGFQLAVEVLWKWEASSKNNVILPSEWAVAEQGCGFLVKRDKKNEISCNDC
jgi:hypothetical protein